MGNPADWVIPGIGAAANIVGGAIARGQALKDDRRNYQRYLENRAYNEPKNQLARIREAGLPAAAYFTGGASSQSAAPSGGAYETDNGIGAAGESISKYMSTRLQRIQAEAAEENLAILKNQRKISDLETDIQLNKEVDQDNPISTYDPETASYNEEFTIRPHYAIMKTREEKQKAANLLGTNLSNDIKEIAKKYAEDERAGNKALSDERLKQEIERTTQATIETTMKQLDLDYAQNEYTFKKGVLELRKMIFDSIRAGKIPSIKDLILQGMLILENRL